MKLLEFISSCTLKGYVLSKENIDANWDANADSHWKITIVNGRHRTNIAYAVIGDTGLVMSSSLHIQTRLGVEFIAQPDFELIVETILEYETA